MQPKTGRGLLTGGKRKQKKGMPLLIISGMTLLYTTER
jgi:hypothetical protein